MAEWSVCSIIYARESSRLLSAVEEGFTRESSLKKTEDLQQVIHLLNNKKPSEKTLLVFSSSDEISVCKELPKILHAEHLPDAVILLISFPRFNSIVDATKMAYTDLGVPFFIFDPSSSQKEIVSGLRAPIEMLKRGISIPPRMRASEKAELRWCFVGNPGPIVQCARDTLCVSKIELASALGNQIDERRIQKLETDFVGSQFSTVEWRSLCEVLELDPNCHAQGYHLHDHLVRVSLAISSGFYRLPVKDELIQKIARLTHCSSFGDEKQRQ